MLYIVGSKSFCLMELGGTAHVGVVNLVRLQVHTLCPMCSVRQHPNSRLHPQDAWEEGLYYTDNPPWLEDLHLHLPTLRSDNSPMEWTIWLGPKPQKKPRARLLGEASSFQSNP